MPKKKRYELSKDQKRHAKREVELLLFALSIDSQWAVRELCYLFQCLELPNTLYRAEQLEKLERELALYREKVGFGRVWTASQLKRAFYATTEIFRRPTVQPMTKEEALAFGPSKLPRIDTGRILRHRVQVDLPNDEPAPRP